MQSQMIGMQSSLDRILAALQAQQTNAALPQQPIPYATGPGQGNYRDTSPYPGTIRNGTGMGNNTGRSFPPLPGFPPPVSDRYRALFS
jgi:hypothetical protein